MSCGEFRYKTFIDINVHIYCLYMCCNLFLYSKVTSGKIKTNGYIFN